MKYVYIGLLVMLASAFISTAHYWWGLASLIGIIWIERRF